MSAPVLPKLRYRRDNPCPICGGWEGAPRGSADRCWGFRSGDDDYARCTREERAGNLTMEPNTEAYVHRLVGDCHCGTRHDPSPPIHTNGKHEPRRIARTYQYVDEEGRLLFEVVRWDPKGFSQRRRPGPDDPPDKIKSGWIWGLNGCRRVPYQFPDLIAADPSRFVIIVEGEKDADALRALGLIATSAPEGAGKWRDEYAVYFVDRKVVILPDNDKAGRKHGEKVAGSLYELAADVRVVSLPGLPEGGDVSDWLAAGGTVDELRRLTHDASQWEPSGEPPSERMSYPQSSAAPWKPSGYMAGDLMNMELPEPRHVVDGLLAEGSGILAGRPKIGKSWFAWQLAIAVARGEKVFGRATTNGGDVAYLALEDNTRRLKSRLGKLLAGSIPPKRLEVFNEWRRLDDGGLEALDEWLTNATEPRLVIIDTFAKIKPRRPRNTDPYDHDHMVMSTLTALAGKHHVAILIVHHTRKALSDDFIDSVTGTLGLSGGTDATLVLARSRGQVDATLSITGRDVDEQELALSFDAETCAWTLMGDADDYRISTARQEIVNVVKASGKPIMPNQVAKVLEKNRNTIRWHMAEMGKDGTLKAWDDGVYTYPKSEPSETDQHPQQAQPMQQAQHDYENGVSADGGACPVGPVGSLDTETPDEACEEARAAL